MIITQTPLRISICGGGTDFKEYYSQNEGFVLSTAIDKYIYVILKERYDDYIYVNYTKKEIVKTVDEIEHDLVREAARLTNIKNGFEVTMLADIPSAGSGLGSSSCLTVGLLNAFYNFQGTPVTQERLAIEACQIEIDILKKPIGKQDQYIAAYGGLATIKFKKDDTVEISKINIINSIKRRLGSNLLLFFTDITRKADGILSEQKAGINDNIEYHDQIKQLALDAVKALEERNVDAIGILMAKNWKLKKQLASKISNNEIDKMYSQSMNNGALGGKIAGAGGGGFLLCYCKRDKQDELRNAMNIYREMPFLLAPHGSKVIFDYTTYNWK